MKDTHRETWKKFRPSQKQCSCVHNSRFGTVRKHVTKQKKGCERNHTHTFNSKWNRNSVFNVYILEYMDLQFISNRNKYDHSNSHGPKWIHLVSIQKGNRHHDHILLNLITFQRENMNCLLLTIYIHIPTNTIVDYNSVHKIETCLHKRSLHKQFLKFKTSHE